MMETELDLKLDQAYRNGQLDYMRIEHDKKMETILRMPFIPRKIYSYSMIAALWALDRYKNTESTLEHSGMMPKTKQGYRAW